MLDRPLPADDRAAVSYSDVVMAFAVLVTFVAVAPLLFRAVNLVQAEADPLTATIIQLAPPLILIGVIVGAGISARAG